MKKLRTDTGGYALIYVLIIVLVLCAVAVTICTAALENYQAQEESVRQTQQLYQAEGEIEKFVALAEKVSSLQYFGEYDSEDVAKAAAKAVYVEHLKNLVSVHPTPPRPAIPTSTSANLRLLTKTIPFALRQRSA